MKIIFLDHDGVITLFPQFGGRFKKKSNATKKGVKNLEDVNYRFDNFDKKAISVLNSILKETGAEIVVSSDWQNFATLQELGEYYESQGIIKKPIGVTKEVGEISQIEYESFPWHRNFEYEQTRSLEILKWLKEHSEVTHWVAIDDLDMAKRNDWGLTNFVHTPKIREGIKQTGVKEKLINFLT